jgi:chemotaxis family two-component system sensor kinase Cph1
MMTAPKDPQFGTADLTNCDREPIHIPGSIQPHGVLIAVDLSDMRVSHAGGNTQSVLEVTVGEVLGRRIFDVVSDELKPNLIRVLEENSLPTRPRHVFSYSLAASGLKVDVAAHRSGDLLILEFEPQAPAESDDFLSDVQEIIRAIQIAGTVEEFCEQLAREVRRFCGFDRVMVYRFLPDGAGVVVSEGRRDDLSSYLGLHYPRSDIPQQARDLYVRNPLRLIPDVRYEPAPLVAWRNSNLEPVDLSQSSLRSVSPLHLEYLQNMGVAASMSLSLIVAGRLWGLVACHHLSPRRLTRHSRVSLELISEMASYLLEVKESAQELAFRLERKDTLELLVSHVSKDQDLTKGLTQSHASLMGYIPSDGVCVWLDGEFVGIGRTPLRDDVAQIVAWLNETMIDGVFQTNYLSSLYSNATPLAGVASGLLALSISRSPRDYVIWFRGEVIRNVTWAGNPDKPCERSNDLRRLSPRKSFDAWKSEVRLQSAPWSNAEIDTVKALRVSLLEVVLRRTDQIAREREEAQIRQQAMLNELDRRIKLWEATASELKRQGEQKTFVENRLSMILRNTVLEQDAERQRIARELHDTLGQYLAVMQLDLDGIGRRADVGSDLNTRIAKLKALTADIGQEVNRIAWVLRPTSLDDLGLQSAAQQFLEDWSETTNIRFDFHSTLRDQRLLPEVEGALYRILQEAITNVVKHADATKVGVILEYSKSKVRLIVEDDGKGFHWDDSVDSTLSAERLGLLGIRERLAAVRGSLEIETAPGRGATLIINVPI